MAALGAVTLIAACGGSDSKERNPSAEDLRFNAVEDQPLSGQVRGQAAAPPSYDIVTAPSHGQVTLEAATGNFQYIPNPDYFGPDTFMYVARSASGQASRPAMVSISVAGVNDPPTLDAIPDLQNSPDQLEVEHPLNAADVDGDSLNYSANVADTSIATVEFDQASHPLRVTPLKRGETSIDVEVRDAQTSARRSFKFTIDDVTKSAMTTLASSEANAADADASAIWLTNDSTRDVSFTLSHNGFPQFRSDMDMVEYVRAIPPVFEGEPFERKLWRFVRNNVYHWPPLSEARWHNDPWVTLTSLGWGFCSNVAATYVRVARAAGYEARVWNLMGHVVPEIKIAGRWQMFDPDLALYYYNSNGKIAGVEELVQNPNLITAPINAVLDKIANPFPYGAAVAGIYASDTDNYLADAVFLPEPPPARPAITLPAGAQLAYPGIWTPAPVGFDGNVPYDVPSFLQGKLTLPAGWTGPISIPWMVADIQGAGRVRIGEQEVEIGSNELKTALQSNQSLTEQLGIVESRSPIHIIMFMNALRYQTRDVNQISIEGVDVWAIQLKSRLLAPEHRITGPGAEVFRKPRPIGY